MFLKETGWCNTSFLKLQDQYDNFALQYHVMVSTRQGILKSTPFFAISLLKEHLSKHLHLNYPLHPVPHPHPALLPIGQGDYTQCRFHIPNITKLKIVLEFKE